MQRINKFVYVLRNGSICVITCHKLILSDYTQLRVCVYSVLLLFMGPVHLSYVF